MIARKHADGRITDHDAPVAWWPAEETIELDEIEKHAPGARLVTDPTNPRKAIVAPPLPKSPDFAEQLQALTLRVAALEAASSTKGE